MSAARAALAAVLFLQAATALRGQDGLKKGLDLLKEGRWSDAAEALEPLLESQPNHFDLLLGLATARYNLNDMAVANGYAVRAETLKPDHAEAASLVGRTFYWMADDAKSSPGATSGKIDGLYEECASSLRKALKLDPKNTENWMLLGHACRQMSKPRFEDAVKAFGEAAKLDPTNADVPAAIIETHVFASNFGAAAAAADEAAQRFPKSAKIRRMKGEALRNQGKPDEAAQAFADGLLAAESDPATDDQIAIGLWHLTVGAATKNVPLAVSSYRRWSEAEGADCLPWYWLGHALLENGEVDPAIAAFRKGDEVTGGRYPKAKLAIADALSKKGDVEQAAAAYYEAWRSGPELYAEDAKPLNAVWAASGKLAEGGDFEKAIRLLESWALKMDPNHWSILQNLGFFYREWGTSTTNRSDARERWKKSSEYYVKASKLVLEAEGVPSAIRAQVLNDTGLMFHYHLDDLKSALDYYRKALEQDDSYVDALENTGKVLNLVGKYEEAIPYFEKVLASPGQAQRGDSLRGRAHAIEKLGRKD